MRRIKDGYLKMTLSLSNLTPWLVFNLDLTLHYPSGVIAVIRKATYVNILEIPPPVSLLLNV